MNYVRCAQETGTRLNDRGALKHRDRVILVQKIGRNKVSTHRAKPQHGSAALISLLQHAFVDDELLDCTQAFTRFEI